MEDKFLESAGDIYKSEECIFQQDNALCHTVQVCKRWFNTHDETISEPFFVTLPCEQNFGRFSGDNIRFIKN